MNHYLISKFKDMTKNQELIVNRVTSTRGLLISQAC